MSQKSYDGAPTLYVIPTPIGNFEDITLRTLEVLKNLEILFCEDTRVTGLLLKHFDIKCRLITNHSHNEKGNCDKIIEFLKEGNDVGIVSDRGTPIISDPGCEVTKSAIKHGFNVVTLPGPTALIPAIVNSGLDASKFLFYGFLDSKKTKRVKQLQELRNFKFTLIFYEAPHRLDKTLADMKEVLGNRKVSISREISKKFEEIYRGDITDIIKEVEGAKGEFVIVVDGNKEQISFEDISILDHIELYMQSGLGSKEAIKQVAKDRNLKKDVVYKSYHQK